MAILNFLRGVEKTSAQQARERLQIILSHEGARRHRLPPQFKEDLIALVRRYFPAIQAEDVQATAEQQDHRNVLEINISLPERSY